MQSGSTIRTFIDGKPYKFTVESILFEDDDRGPTGFGGPERWTELLIIRTAKGSFAVRVAARVRTVDDGAENTTWWLAKSEVEVARSIADAASPTDRNDDPGDDVEIPSVLAKRALKKLGWWDLVAEEV